MKNIFCLLCMLLSLYAVGQINQNQGSPNTNLHNLGFAQDDSARRLPLDSLARAQAGSLAFLGNGRVYFKGTDLHWHLLDSLQGLQSVLSVEDSTNLPMRADSINLMTGEGPGIYYAQRPDNFDSVYTSIAFPDAGTQMGWMQGAQKFPGVNADGRPNVVYSIGYNVLPNGGRINSNEASWRMGFESHFRVNSQPSFEFHFPEINLTNGTSFRPFSMYIGKDNGFTENDMTADSYNFSTNHTINPDSSGFFVSALNELTTFNVNASGTNSASWANTVNGNSYGFAFSEFGPTYDLISGTNNPAARFQFNSPISILENGTQNQGLGTTSDMTGSGLFGFHATGSVAGSAFGFDNDVTTPGTDFIINNNTGTGNGMYINGAVSGTTTYRLQGGGGQTCDLFYDGNATQTLEFINGTGVISSLKNTGQWVIGGTVAAATGLLEMQSSTQGFLPPRMTTTARLAIGGGTPDEGLIVYDITLHQMFYWNGLIWASF